MLQIGTILNAFQFCIININTIKGHFKEKVFSKKKKAKCFV